MVIESMQNPLAKRLQALSRRSEREAAGVFVAEGERFVSEVPSDWPLEAVVASVSFWEQKGFLGLEKRGAAAVFSDRLFQKVCDTQSPQGILAVCRQKQYDVGQVLSAKNGLFLILEALQDPGNLGTILRTADACGADGVFLSKGSVDLYNPKVLRSTMGSIFHIPVLQNQEVCDMIKAMEETGIAVYAAHLRGESPYTRDFRCATAFLIGNEGRGLTKEAAEAATGKLALPMPGRAESLNAAVAAGVFLYEALRQRLC